jgi:type VI secretion system secreted protein Hcp
MKGNVFRSLVGWLAVVLLFALPVFTLPGAVDMFIKIDDVKGESQDADHKDEIDVLSWNWDMSNAGTTHTGTSGSGKVSVQDLSFTKYIDRASPELMLKCLNGQHFNQATLTVRKAGKVPLEYIKLDMKKILVTSVSTGGSGGEDRLTEKVTLNFAEFKLTYTPQSADGKVGSAVDVGWNIAENTGE